MSLEFDLIPYLSVGDIRFGMHEPEVDKLAGRPRMRDLNRREEIDCRYEGWSVRYSKDEGKVVEFGFTPQINVKYRGIQIFRDSDAFEKLIQADGNPFEHLGFIVLLQLGITLTGFHDGDDSQKAVTAFSGGRWDHLKPKLHPFSA